MHDVDVETVARTVAHAQADPASARQPLRLAGEWTVDEGAPQFRGTIPFPQGEVDFLCDFPPQMGGNGAAPNPLAYCFWGGLARYAMTYAVEAREGSS